MTLEVVQDKLLQRLMDMPGRPPIAHPNGPLVEELPRIVVQYVQSPQRPFDMEGQTQVDAEINARIEVAKHKGTGEVRPIIAAIHEQFKPATEFDGVTIMQAPDPRTRITRDDAYVVPVVIRGRADF